MGDFLLRTVLERESRETRTQSAAHQIYGVKRKKKRRGAYSPQALACRGRMAEAESRGFFRPFLVRHHGVL